MNHELFNSDHAFIGLQAIRQLKGEWFWSLWGSTYQGPIEAQVISLLIPVFGVSNLVLFLGPMIAFVLCLWLCFKIFSENTTPFRTFLLLLFLAVGARIYMVQQVIPYRQWCILFILVSLYFSLRKKPLTKVQSFLMGFAPFFAYYTDNFVIQFLPAVFLCSYLRNYYREKSFYLFFGNILGAVFIAIVAKLMPEGMGAPVSFSIHFPNTALFFKECLPEIFSLKWIAFFLLGYFVFQSARVVAKKNVSLELKLSFLFGLVSFLSCVGGFCGKHLIMDKHAVRYLTPLIYSIPFLLLPYFSESKKKDVLLLVPYFMGVVALLNFSKPICPSYDFWRKVQPWLEEKKVLCGYSNYWLAYQYTFLANEKVIVVPRELPFTGPNRYLPYKETVKNCPVVVEIFLPQEQALKDSLVKEWKSKKWIENIFESEQYAAIVRKNL
jgi:hypothetical protein